MAMPPNMFNNPQDFRDEVMEEEEEDEAREEHVHGPDCGHEAVEHGDHVDYVVGEHRHWWNRGRWEQH